MEKQRPQIGVGVAVFHQGKVLLGKRKGAHGAGQWAFPGGKLDWKESVEACAARELFEETGLKATSIRLGPWVENVIDEQSHYLTIFAFVESFAGTLQLLEPEKCECWDWFPWTDMPQPLFPPIASLLQIHPQRQLIDELLAFYKARDWDQFHSPKNLVTDLASEVGELLEPFRWLTEQQSYCLSEKVKEEVRDEIGDVFAVLVYLSYKLGIDPLEAAQDKLLKTGLKYPVEKCKGKALKYTAYEDSKF